MKYWLVILLFFPLLASAQELNTGVLPALWYSKTDVQEGDNIKIYGGIQNHSSVKFSGLAVWSVDGDEIKSSPFVSDPDTLIELEAEWLATHDEHTIELRITDLKPPASAIWSESTGKIKLEVKRNLSPEIIKKDALKAASGAAQKVDSMTGSLADKIDDYRAELAKPTPGLGSSVLGTSTERVMFNKITEKPAVASVFGFVLGFFATLLRHWRWTLGTVLALFLISKIFRR